MCFVSTRDPSHVHPVAHPLSDHHHNAVPGLLLRGQVALFVNSDTGRYNLKFDFFTIFEDVWVEDMEIKVRPPHSTCCRVSSFDL